MEKIYIKDLAKVSNVTHVVGIDTDGNSVLIDKSNLAADIASYIPATKGEVWIVYLDSDKNRILVPWEQWTTSRTDAAGVAIMSGGRRLLIAPHESSLYWSSVAGSGGAVTTTVKTTADVDYAGQSNTSKIVASAAFAGDGDGYAPGYCAAYSNGGVDTGSWWLPSLGELGMIYEKYDAINAALEKISGATQLSRVAYWSSTEYSDTYAWALNFSSGGRWGNAKATGKGRVRPVTAF